MQTYWQRWFPWRNWIRPWHQIDQLLLLLPIGLTLLGGGLIRSTQLHQGWTDWLQHWIIGGVGIVLALMIARVPYVGLLQWHWLVYLLTNLSLLAVKLIGTSALGAQRWITILGFNVQPSEFAKLGLIISLAALLHHQAATTIPVVIRTLAIAAVPWILVFLQPDLGTSLVFGAIALGMIYWANANPGWIVLMISPIVAAILLNIPLGGHWSLILWACWAVAMGAVGWFSLPKPVLGALGSLILNLVSGGLGRVLWGLLEDYQRDRLILFLDPDKDPLGGGYHLIQSRIAIGAGGLWGTGINQGTQTQLNFIPEQHTDFIFAAVGGRVRVYRGIGRAVGVLANLSATGAHCHDCQ